MSKPTSPSFERNKEPLLSVLRYELTGQQHVLEIASGTGQHACFFAKALPNITWQPTELPNNLPGIESWLEEYQLNNVAQPVALDVNQYPWPIKSADVCITNNTFHIVSIESVQAIFRGAKSVLGESGKLYAYGPYIIDGKHTSPSNVEFDQWLRDTDSQSGIRDLAELDNMAVALGYKSSRRIAMPANNFLAVWEIA